MPVLPREDQRPFAAALIHRAGQAEPSFAAAICADCAGTAEEATAAGEALARRMGQRD